jgi:hypothetical protein
MANVFSIDGITVGVRPRSTLREAPRVRVKRLPFDQKPSRVPGPAGDALIGDAHRARMDHLAERVRSRQGDQGTPELFTMHGLERGHLQLEARWTAR